MRCLILKKLTSKIIGAFLVLTSVVGVSSCDASKTYSKITEKCDLTVEFTEKDFVTDGIGQAEFMRAADGDTATFRLIPSGTVVTIRFYGIDTPESTGSIEKWGRSASMFTKEKLENAHSFVLEATSTPASHDSYGVRYLGYVWYRNSEKDDWKNLNLQLVENGLSENACLQTSAYKYYTYFKEAEDFAMKKKIHLWSNDEDPYFSNEAVEINLKDLIENPDNYYVRETDSGYKVHFEGYITGLNVSDSGTYMFVAAQLIDGVEYKYPIYAGYASNPVARYMKVGNMYSITGLVQLYGGSFQISGLTYVPLTEGVDYLKKTQDKYYYIFNNDTIYSDNYAEVIYTNPTITEASVTGTTLTFKATSKLIIEDGFGEVEEFTFIVPVEEGFDPSTVIGRTFSTKGYRFDSSKNEITILSYRDILFK